MCGIFGTFSLSRQPDLAECHAALDSLTYRGPDDSGTYSDEHTFLGHRRLAIIDLNERSRQPMQSACGRYLIVLNGEIYNYIELRDSLAEYHPFQTTSDTEVALAAYCHYGSACLEHLDGMFALVIYDKKTESFFVARDRIGKKPLFYSLTDKTFSFASEIKALRKLSIVSKDIDTAALNDYFMNGYITGERTLFSDIRKLRPGHFMEVVIDKTNNRLQHNTEAYWHLLQAPADSFQPEADLIERGHDLLRSAVSQRMRADVPVGVFLSGGLDSSLVAAMAAETSRDLNAFTISFSGSAADETDFAKSIAKNFGFNHHVFDVNESLLDGLPDLIASLDEPFADSSFIPTFFVNKMASQHNKVVLSGDGGDELCAGYEHYDSFLWEESLRAEHSATLLKTVGAVASLLPERHKTRTIKRLVHGDPYQSMLAYYSRFFNQKERQKMLGMLSCSVPENDFLNQFSRDRHWLEDICQADFQHYMVDDILVKVDRMSMLNSLEVRSPLLDHNVAEFFFREVPLSLKNKNGTKKYILKKIAERYLPEDYQWERKHGFGVPLGPWFKGALLTRLQTVLDAGDSGYLNRSYVKKLMRSHQRGLSNYSKKLFAILIWEEWYQMHIGQSR